ncbi:gluconokinase [Sulfitobacter sp. S190]|nr:gluconokinase [Sulfitobacter sp. S190]
MHTAFVIMGVCGVGKTSVGRALAENLDAQYLEADDFHSDENRAAMARGVPLSDRQRMPWLTRLSDEAEKMRANGPVVLACSALRRSYRDLLRKRIGRVHFVFLHGDRALLEQRITNRTDHFMPVSLLDSQIATLDPPTPDEGATHIDVAPSKAAVNAAVEHAIRTLGLPLSAPKTDH